MVSIFFFNDTATTEIYTLSLHDALPILPSPGLKRVPRWRTMISPPETVWPAKTFTPNILGLESRPLRLDRKSTRLNSSHSQISYAVFCLKQKTNLAAFARPKDFLFS